MRCRINIIGESPSLVEGLATTLEDCGFGPVSVGASPGEAGWPGGAYAGDAADMVFILEARTPEDASAIVDSAGGMKRPFIVYSEEGLERETVRTLREAGLVGVIRRDTAPEEAIYLVNRALFYRKMLKRNPRVPVDIPVIMRIGGKSVRTNATQLSRDGIFIVTLSPPGAGETCEVEFALPGSTRRFRTTGRVIYNVTLNTELKIISSPEDPFRRLVAHPGAAVFFLGLPEEEREFLDGYIDSLC